MKRVILYLYEIVSQPAIYSLGVYLKAGSWGK